MPRIQTHVNGTSSPPPRDEPDRDTADRSREAHMRGPMHETRESLSDARNTPRLETADLAWRQPLNLDAPPPRPGMVQRWVRAELRSEVDNLNWQTKNREGWTPRDPATIPDHESYFGTASHRGASVIRVGGLILMEMPEERLRSKRRYIKELSRRQEQSVSAEVEKVSREGVANGMSPIMREEEGTVSTGRRPVTMAD